MPGNLAFELIAAPAAREPVITSLALQSPGAGRSWKRVAGTAAAAARSCAIAAWTLSTISAGASLAPWATR